jgi:hypothetical protein
MAQRSARRDRETQCATTYFEYAALIWTRSANSHAGQRLTAASKAGQMAASDYAPRRSRNPPCPEGGVHRCCTKIRVRPDRQLSVSRNRRCGSHRSHPRTELHRPRRRVDPASSQLPEVHNYQTIRATTLPGSRPSARRSAGDGGRRSWPEKVTPLGRRGSRRAVPRFLDTKPRTVSPPPLSRWRAGSPPRAVGRPHRRRSPARRLAGAAA